METDLHTRMIATFDENGLVETPIVAIVTIYETSGGRWVQYPAPWCDWEWIADE